MKNIDIARVWKDKEYRDNFSAEELANIPSNPAGVVQLDDASLETIKGGWGGASDGISIFCPTVQFDQNASCACNDF